MPSRVQDFLRTAMGIAEIQNERNRLEETRRQAHVAGINTFMTLARQTADPAQLTALVDRFSELGVGSKDQLLSILQNVTPSGEAISADQTRQGIKVVRGGSTGTAGGDRLARRTASQQLTGRDAGQLAAADMTAAAIARTPLTDDLASAITSRSTSQMTPGQVILDAAIGNLPQSELDEAAGVGIGTRESAGQAGQLDLGWAGLRQNWALGIGSQALTETGQAIEKLNAAARLKAANSPIPDATAVASLVGTKAGMVRELTSTKETPPPGLVLSYIGALNSINRQLDLAGVPNEGQIPYDPELLTDPAFFAALKRRLAGGASTPVIMSPNTGRLPPMPGAASPHTRTP